MNLTKKPHFIILKNESRNDHEYWIRACEDHGAYCTYSVIDLTTHTWLEQIQSSTFDYLLAKPGGLTAPFKQLYDERVYILSEELKLPVFPTIDEILIYENKRYFAYWLKAHQLPCPETEVFYHKQEALSFIENSSFPIVAKINIGASGNGVSILKTREEAFGYVNNAFDRGIASRTGPRLDKGKLIKRAWRKLTHPAELRDRLSAYKSVAADVQKGFVIFQEYIKHDFEWRCVRIGESFFAHKKVVEGEMASGLLKMGYEDPPKDLLTFVKEITDRFGFFSQTVDIFESSRGYLINEMQCIFGQAEPYQMLVDDKPGRYIYQDGKWVFEEGMFNTNKSYDLRVKYLLSKFNI